LLIKAFLIDVGGTPKIHFLVLVHGRERAQELVDDRTWPLIDIAAEVMTDETQRVGVLKLPRFRGVFDGYDRPRFGPKRLRLR
jgi:hypothetical protein